MRLDKSWHDSMMETARFYHHQLPGSPAEEYLETRGLSIDRLTGFGVGYSGETEPGHSQFHGRLVIPYVREMMGRTFVVGMKFRKLDDTKPGAKYLGLGSPKLFNTADMIVNDREITVCEGELDAMTASINGIPAVGVPGVSTWQSYWTQLFLGYETVWLPHDGDQPGKEFSDKIVALLGPVVRVIPMPPGMDVNSVVQEYGIEWLKDRMA